MNTWFLNTFKKSMIIRELIIGNHYTLVIIVLHTTNRFQILHYSYIYLLAFIKLLNFKLIYLKFVKQKQISFRFNWEKLKNTL